MPVRQVAFDVAAPPARCGDCGAPVPPKSGTLCPSCLARRAAETPPIVEVEKQQVRQVVLTPVPSVVEEYLHCPICFPKRRDER